MEKVKKPFYKRVWFIILAVVIVIGVIAAIAGGGSDDKDAKDKAPVTYEAYSVTDMMSQLDANAMAAADTFDEKDVEISGRVLNIDSDGKYLSVGPADNEWAIVGVMCYLTDDAQKEVVKQLANDDNVIVKGHITEVGEVLGYSLDIDTIEKQ